jgi:farnesyl diphosphate synthase
MTMTINTASIDHFVQPLQQRINQQLKTYLPTPAQQPTRLHEAMHYAVFNGGKRIRPLLVYATGLCLQTDLAALDAAAVAIELIHCYSLIHDDLPAMDDDDYRRGKLSCHKAFDEATAILAGDALQSLAFALLSQPNAYLNHHQQIKMLHVLATATGSLGMAGGQQLDLEGKNKNLSTIEIETIHQLKTGALFQASVHLGIFASACNDTYQIKQLEQFAQLIGLAFQWQDDHFDQDQQNFDIKNRIAQLFAQARQLLNAMTIDYTPLLAMWQYLQDR